MFLKILRFLKRRVNEHAQLNIQYLPNYSAFYTHTRTQYIHNRQMQVPCKVLGVNPKHEWNEAGIFLS